MLPGTRPIIIAHRGASAQRPEHTLAAYALAIAQGADFIEPDLVATADGELIARHENALAVLSASGELDRGNTSTDVHSRPEFAARLTSKVIDGETVRGWFSEDFTLAEIRRLRAVERIPTLRPQNAAYDGEFSIPTLAEIVALVKEEEARSGRRIGIYPETKHPSYFAQEGRRHDGSPIGIDLSALLVNALCGLDFTDPTRVFIQSFETGNLQTLANVLLPAADLVIPLIQLIDATGAPRDLVLSGDPRQYADLITPRGLAQISHYAQGIGVPKRLVFTEPAQVPTRLVLDAHAAGLDVHVWTFRPENHFLPAQDRVGDGASDRGRLADELARQLRAGIDGFFTDDPAAGVAAVRAGFPALPG